MTFIPEQFVASNKRATIDTARQWKEIKKLPHNFQDKIFLREKPVRQRFYGDHPSTRDPKSQHSHLRILLMSGTYSNEDHLNTLHTQWHQKPTFILSTWGPAHGSPWCAKNQGKINNSHQRLENKNWSLKMSQQCTWAPAAQQRRHFSRKDNNI